MPDDRGTWRLQIVGIDAYLADYSDVVAREDNEGGPIIQDESLAFGAKRFYADRGNTEIPRIFTITKEFDDNEQSTDWFEIGAFAYAGVHDVVIWHRDYNGLETRFNLYGAAVRIRAQAPIGICVITRVTITGGALTTDVNDPNS